uniref:CUB domain-containing protein n=1 Tax=Panagrolaimus sp. JU765 TaxID=591449 RepID=A0AC34R0P0_9BILA
MILAQNQRFLALTLIKATTIVICTVSIPKNTAYVLQATERYLEYLADELVIFENNTGSPNILVNMYNYDAYVFEGENNIFLSFTSDKNINGAGFMVTQTSLCKQ